MTWTLVLLLGAGAYLCKVIGLVVLGARHLPPALERCLALVPAALLSALIVRDTFTSGQEYVLEITAWEPGRLMGVRHDGLVTGDGRFTLEPLDEGRRVRFTWIEDLTVPWWLGGRVTARFGGRQVMARIWHGNLSRLRRLVEPAP